MADCQHRTVYLAHRCTGHVPCLIPTDRHGLFHTPPPPPWRALPNAPPRPRRDIRYLNVARDPVTQYRSRYIRRNVDIFCDCSRIFQLCSFSSALPPHAPCAIPYFLPLLTGCRLVLAIRCHAQSTSLDLGVIHVFRYNYLRVKTAMAPFFRGSLFLALAWYQPFPPGPGGACARSAWPWVC